MLSLKITRPLYFQVESVRSRYERESSTSDSVFSPDRRKSSASSKSLDEDVAMITGQDYSDTPRSLSDSSTPWQDSSGTSLDTSERPRYGGINRSPTTRVAPESYDKLGKHTSKSPLSENVEQIKQITLSSPSEFQFKKYHQPNTGSYPASMATGSFDPQRLPPMFEMVSPQKMADFAAPNISGEESSGSMTYVSKTSGDSTAKSSLGSVGSVGDDDIGERSPVNLTGSSNIPQGKAGASGEVSPLSTGSESVFSQYPVYKVPFSNYGDRSARPKTSSSEEGGISLVYRPGYEGEEMDGKYKPPHLPPDYGQSQVLAEPYSSLTEDREYHSELGEIYRLPKKMETKLYQQRHGGMSRKMKSAVDRRGSDTVQAFETATTASFVHLKDKEALSEMSKLSQEMMGQSDISKSFEEAVKIQQSIFQSSLGLLSPLPRQFIQPGRPYPQRERSQSLSEFHTLTSHELSHHAGRARFPSSSYAENLDAPLVIDDDSKADETREGLDLSNKKRKMSVDEVYATPGDEQTEGASGGGGGAISTGQGEEIDYERMAQSQLQGGATGTSRDDSGGSTKKYGKGNFIKVATGYQCRICCRVIRHMNNTTAHMRIHANVKPYKCQVCNQQFKYEVDRRYHFSKNHVDLFSKMYFPEEKKSG